MDNRWKKKKKKFSRSLHVHLIEDALFLPLQLTEKKKSRQPTNSITVSVCVAGVGGVSFAYLYTRSRCKLCNISMEVPALDDPPIPVAEQDNARQKHIMMMMTTSMIFSLAKGLGVVHK